VKKLNPRIRYLIRNRPGSAFGDPRNRPFLKAHLWTEAVSSFTGQEEPEDLEVLVECRDLQAVEALARAGELSMGYLHRGFSVDAFNQLAGVMAEPCRGE
jgi:hypothetical protein